VAVLSWGVLLAAARLEGCGAVTGCLAGDWAPPHLVLGGVGWLCLCRRPPNGQAPPRLTLGVVKWRHRRRAPWPRDALIHDPYREKPDLLVVTDGTSISSTTDTRLLWCAIVEGPGACEVVVRKLPCLDPVVVPWRHAVEGQGGGDSGLCGIAAVGGSSGG
jgi:hypothetical protein